MEYPYYKIYKYGSGQLYTYDNTKFKTIDEAKSLLSKNHRNDFRQKLIIVYTSSYQSNIASINPGGNYFIDL